MDPIVPVWFTSTITGLLLLLVILVAYKVLVEEIRAHRRAIRKERLSVEIKRRIESEGAVVPYVMHDGSLRPIAAHPVERPNDV